MREDVLTKEERELVEALRSFGAFAGSPASDHFESAAKSVVALCDRLCARIEKLEAVAKAARGARLVLGTSPLDDSDGDIAYHGLRAALAALKESK